jgi:hypothetical protein
MQKTSSNDAMVLVLVDAVTVAVTVAVVVLTVLVVDVALAAEMTRPSLCLIRKCINCVNVFVLLFFLFVCLFV